MRNMKAYYKSRSSGQWVLLSQGTIDGENYPKGLSATVVSGRPDIVSLGNGAVSVRPPTGDLHFHGWCCGRALPNPADIAAIHITLQARLAVHDASRPDDRPAARYLVQVGGDYYPDASLNLNLFAPVTWNPGIGLSRSKLVGNAWQSYSFTTIDAGVQDPGGAAISEAELRRAPPPLDGSSSRPAADRPTGDPRRRPDAGESIESAPSPTFACERCVPTRSDARACSPPQPPCPRGRSADPTTARRPAGSTRSTRSSTT
jgi:hypothetical protein